MCDDENEDSAIHYLFMRFIEPVDIFKYYQNLKNDFLQFYL